MNLYEGTLIPRKLPCPKKFLVSRLKIFYCLPHCFCCWITTGKWQLWNWKISNYLVLRFLKWHNKKCLEIMCPEISQSRKLETSELKYIIIFGLEIMTVWIMDPFARTSNRHNLCYFKTALSQLILTVNVWKWWLIFWRYFHQKVYLFKKFSIKRLGWSIQNVKFTTMILSPVSRKNVHSEELKLIVVNFIIWLPVVYYYCREFHPRCCKPSKSAFE